MLLPGLNNRIAALSTALCLSAGFTSGLTSGLALPTAGPAFTSNAASSLAGPTAQRGRSGRSPRAKLARPSQPKGQPRGISPSTATNAIRGGRSLGPAAGDSDRGELGGGIDDVKGPAFRHPPERQQRLWFSIADDDSSGWISYREASASMRFDAPRFCVFDVDNDGRLTYEEFNGYIVGESARNRRIIAPVAISLGAAPRKRSPEQLRAAYDSDSDGAVSRFEFQTILRDYDQEAQAFDTGDVFVRLDANDSKTLEIDELGRLASFLNPLKVLSLIHI